ncbi:MULTISPECIES: hypothetical protein [Aeromonas]|uniref:Uncharacterized protein n=1 Tax=Aeromonas veronii TaxID=654 RepID=A0A4S5CP34_AERVE|nr:MULTISPECIES: hypothetical protein [Aeromonas]THJ44946.1 hypothetical protein E8Q35_12210 [Aeromonas veronii]
MKNDEILTVEVASERLSPYLSQDYKWPSMPIGWQLEFIAYPDGDVEMDFLHPVSCAFWSEENGNLTLPIKPDGTNITVHTLISAGVPYMTTFGYAVVSDKPNEPHLKLIAE